jgi:tellurite resistance protein TerC
VFVGMKMLLVDVYKIPIWASLLVIVALVATGVVASLRATRDRAGTGGDDEDPPDVPPADAPSGPTEPKLLEAGT